MVSGIAHRDRGARLAATRPQAAAIDNQGPGAPGCSVEPLRPVALNPAQLGAVAGLLKLAAKEGVEDVEGWVAALAESCHIVRMVLTMSESILVRGMRPPTTLGRQMGQILGNLVVTRPPGQLAHHLPRDPHDPGRFLLTLARRE